MDDVSIKRMSAGHPELTRRLYLLEEKVGLNFFRVTRVFASYNDQAAYYAQGRESILDVNRKRLAVGLAAISPAQNIIVTNAAPGYSAHQFYYAADVDPTLPGFPVFTPDWNELDNEWKELLSVAQECGLAEGANWRVKPDCPHLYLQECPANPTDEMRQTFTDGGSVGVLKMIDDLLHSSAT